VGSSVSTIEGPLGAPNFATSAAFLRTLAELMVLFGIRIFTSRTGFADLILTNAPVRASLSLWYAPYMFATLALLLGLALWSFRTSLGGRPAFKSIAFDA
jgi:hypothetical protein